MVDKLNPLQSLKDKSSEIQSIRGEIDALSGEIQKKKAVYQTKQKSLEEELGRLKKSVAEGILSVGDEIENYVLANYRFYGLEEFSARFREHAKTLRGRLGKLADTRRFWYHQNEHSFSRGLRVYELLFFAGDRSPYVITPTQIKLQSQSSILISLANVFLDEKGEAVWLFVEKTDKEKELVVVPRWVEGIHYDVPQITEEEQCDINALEKIVGGDKTDKVLGKDNPLAVVLFRKTLDLEVTPELQERANQYVHKVAFKALEAIQADYFRVRANDQKIAKIEAEYNPPSSGRGGLRPDMFATRPVIPVPEPDPFMAAIMSREAVGERDWALRRLATCINDLDRTGLKDYAVPMEVQVRAGEKKIYNLFEYAQYVRGVLELSHKEREGAGARS